MWGCQEYGYQWLGSNGVEKGLARIFYSLYVQVSIHMGQ